MPKWIFQKTSGDQQEEKLNNLQKFSASSSVEVVHFSKNGQFFFYKVKEFGKNWTMIMMINFSAT